MEIEHGAQGAPAKSQDAGSGKVARSAIQIGLFGGLIGSLTLSGVPLLGGLIGSAVDGLLMHMPNVLVNIFSILVLLMAMLGGGAAWGWGLGILVGSRKRQQLTRAGLFSYLSSVFVMGSLLSLVAATFVEGSREPPIPIYILYTFLFVPTSFVVGGAGGFAIGRAQRDARLGRELLLKAGISAALAFLAVNTIMEALGYQVGAPGALERATMITVTIVGHLAAAFAAGATLALGLRREIRLEKATEGTSGG